MLTKCSLKLPRSVHSGGCALEQIRSIAEKGYQKAVVFSDQGVAKAGLLERPLELLQKAGTGIQIFDDLPAEPDCDQAQAVTDRFRRAGGDLIVAIGGGSVMDLAKLASVSATDSYVVRDLLDRPELARKCAHTLMIPTTAGTGSEATPNSIVTVPEKELKVGIVNDAMTADYVILDGEMIRELPRPIAAATGVDALAHAIECVTSKKANSFSDTFALEALDLILRSIERACDDPDALDAKNAMLLAAFYAGAAITSSGTTAVHALSYPLGGRFHIPHGVSNAMLLAPVMRFNEPACREQLARAYDRVAGFGGASGQEEKSAWILGRLAEIVKHLDIPASLKAYGVQSEDLDALVEAGMDVKRLLVNNRREVTAADARKLYQEIL